MTEEERITGCVVGLALGDALGAPFEGLRTHRIPRPIPVLELTWGSFPPGTTTDDTALARNLVRSLVARGGFDPYDLIGRHLEWFATDRRGIGSTTRQVLHRLLEGGGPEEVAKAVWVERGPEVSAGNGSVMYCAPLGAAYANRPERLLDLAPQMSALTHYDERCRTAVLAVTLAVAALVRGERAGTAVGSALDSVLDREGGEELEFLVEAVGETRPIDGPDMGFCLFTAAAGLQAVTGDGSFEEGLLRVIALGGDTDTNGAVAGGLLGAALGIDGLPADWLGRLQDREAIQAEARSLADLAARGPR
jgi:ADP-ribosyl-[dinitrogen reductase] hydrolase